MEEFVCADGRMSVNGVCYLSKTSDQKDPPVIIPKKKFDDKYESIEDIKIKDKFEWSFDKVGDTVGNFTDNIKNSVNEFNVYAEDKLGIPNVAGKLIAGAALGPYALPFSFLQALGAKQKAKRDEIQRIQNVTNRDTQGKIQTVDMMTYGIPTVGQESFNIHNDSYDQSGNNNYGGATQDGGFDAGGFEQDGTGRQGY